MDPHDDEAFQICLGYRVGSRPVIDVLDPDFSPIVLPCPGCGQDAWFSGTLIRAIVAQAHGDRDRYPIPICVACMTTEIGWENLPPEIKATHERALAALRAARGT